MSQIYAILASGALALLAVVTIGPEAGQINRG